MKQLLNLLYPRKCPFCGQILKNQNWLICKDCAGMLKPITEPRCKVCGKALEEAEAELCGDCRRHPHAFRAGIGIFPYNAMAHSSVMQYKKGGRRENGRFYVQAAAVYGGDWVRQIRPQVLIPVPMRKREERQRGFAPARELAEGLGRAWGIPVEEPLRKIRKTKPQKELDSRMRRQNLKGAFAGREGVWPWKRILLIDDVYTTGSTLDEAARTAAAHGVREVYFLTVFIGNGY